MTPRLIAQLSWVFEREAALLLGENDWPVSPPTDLDLLEADRLRRIAGELADRAHAAGQATGADYCFGDEVPSW